MEGKVREIREGVMLTTLLLISAIRVRGEENMVSIRCRRILTNCSGVGKEGIVISSEI